MLVYCWSVQFFLRKSVYQSVSHTSFNLTNTNKLTFQISPSASNTVLVIEFHWNTFDCQLTWNYKMKCFHGFSLNLRFECYWFWEHERCFVGSDFISFKWLVLFKLAPGCQMIICEAISSKSGFWWKCYILGYKCEHNIWRRSFTLHVLQQAVCFLTLSLCLKSWGT